MTIDLRRTVHLRIVDDLPTVTPPRPAPAQPLVNATRACGLHLRLSREADRVAPPVARAPGVRRTVTAGDPRTGVGARLPLHPPRRAAGLRLARLPHQRKVPPPMLTLDVSGSPRAPTRLPTTAPSRRHPDDAPAVAARAMLSAPHAPFLRSQDSPRSRGARQPRLGHCAHARGDGDVLRLLPPTRCGTPPTVAHEMQHAEQPRRGAVRTSIDHVASPSCARPRRGRCLRGGASSATLLTGMLPTLDSALASLSSDTYHLAADEVALGRGCWSHTHDDGRWALPAAHDRRRRARVAARGASRAHRGGAFR